MIQTNLVLTKVVYSGDNIGREFTFDFKLENNNYSFNTIIINGETKIYNKVLFSKSLKKPRAIRLSVRVTERDKYEDSGNGCIYVDFGVNKRKTVSLDVEIKEKNKNKDKDKDKSLVANLKFIFKEGVSEFGIRKIDKVDEWGWIRARLVDCNDEPIGNPISLSKGLLVNFYRSSKWFTSTMSDSGGEEYFTIQEGPHKGKNARLILTNGMKTRLIDKPYSEACEIYFRLKNIMTNGDYKGFLDVYIGNKTICKNVYAITSLVLHPNKYYDLFVPDRPHEKADIYKLDTKFPLTWFKIDFDTGSPRTAYYLHFGMRTKGCVTVTKENANGTWNKICNAIIWCRNKNKSGVIGKIMLIDMTNN